VLELTLCNRFVCGLHNESIQKRLLSESNLTLTRAIDIAFVMETAAKDARELQGQRQPEIDVRTITAGKTQLNKVSPTTKKTCYHFNGFHDSSDCSHNMQLSIMVVYLVTH